MNENRFQYVGVMDETTSFEKNIGKIGNPELKMRHILV